MRAARFATALTALAVAFLTTGPVHAYRFNDRLQVWGYLQTWITFYEQMEDAKGLYQFPSGDAATTSTTGLSLNRARIGADVFIIKKTLRLSAQLRLEEQPALLDFYLRYEVRKWLTFLAGQFKVPNTYEYLVLSRDLDFIERSNLALHLSDYCLSRTTYASSLFYGNRSYGRDLGLGIKGDVDIKIGRFRYFVFVGNGLGANLFVSGSTRKEFIITNRPQFFYGVRLSFADLFKVVTVGGHFTYNKHDNMVFNSGRVVYDLNRMSASANLILRIPGSGFQLAGLYGWGVIDDDFDDNGRTDVRYAGWASALIWTLNPALHRIFRTRRLKHHVLQLAFRFDNYSSETDESGLTVQQNNWTVGMNYTYKKFVKLQLNYIIKRTADPGYPDLDDDIVFLSVQAAI